MCRFLLAKSDKQFEPALILQAFAQMSQKSKALDGDWQGDGWGVAWKNDDSTWDHVSSLSPIWEDQHLFHDQIRTNMLVVHARSASFPQDKGVLEFNQPYIQDNFAFVFNGLLKGVSIPYSLEGKIGAQKIWSLLQKYLQDHEPKKALEKTVEDLNKYTRYIQALNIGLSDRENVYGYCQYAKHPEYYNLKIAKENDILLLSSEELSIFQNWKSVDTRQVISL